MSKNLFKRILTSVVLLLILFVVNYSHHYFFILTILILGAIIYIEANNIISKLVGPYLLKDQKDNVSSEKFNFKFIVINLFVFYYIFFIFCLYSYEIHKFEGPTLFIYIVGICFLTDIGGYIFGKLIGGKKLTKISPNKTISGTIGSFIFSTIPLIFFLNLGYLDLELNKNNVLFCILVSLISQLGDLLISFFKRKVKIKDTGKILPGHGGVLDRVDGIIFALPFSYFLLKFI